MVMVVVMGGRKKLAIHSQTHSLLRLLKKILTFVDRIDSPKNGID